MTQHIDWYFIGLEDDVDDDIMSEFGFDLFNRMFSVGSDLTGLHDAETVLTDAIEEELLCCI